MSEVDAGPRLSGRRRQAALNDARILEAAREVFVADSDAPVSAVAARARVGMSAIYRRWASKEDLLRQLCRDGLRRYIEIAEDALRDEGDAWDAFAGFLHRIVETDVHSLTVRLAGTFRPTEEMYAEAAWAGELNERLVARTREAGGLRADIETADLALILEQLSSIRPGVFGDGARTAELRRRGVALILDGMRSPSGMLPGAPPTSDELSRRWIPRSGG